jgi:hypothetical protein
MRFIYEKQAQRNIKAQREKKPMLLLSACAKVGLYTIDYTSYFKLERFPSVL